jgi:hypothetical protein
MTVLGILSGARFEIESPREHAALMNQMRGLLAECARVAT